MADDTKKIHQGPGDGQGEPLPSVGEPKTAQSNPFPRLYVVDTNDSRGFVLRGDGHARLVAIFMAPAEETEPLARFAANAVNCHEELVGALNMYGRHGAVGGPICEMSKHSEYPCTCGFDAILSKAEGRVA